MSTNRKVIIALFTALSVIVAGGLSIVLTSQRSEAEKVMFTGFENHQISYSEGKKMIEGFLHTRVDQGLIAGYYGRNIFEKILAQRECVGIRVYNARLNDGASTFVIIGVDRDGKDMVNGVVGEEIIPCPPICFGPTIDATNTVALSEHNPTVRK